VASWEPIPADVATTIRACTPKATAEAGGVSGESSGGASGDAGAGGDAGASPGVKLPTTFHWSSSDPLVAPSADENHPILSIKDPSIVFFEGRWHVFATTADEYGSWNMVYLTFADWSEAPKAKQHYLSDNPELKGYHAAPQVFFFAPQKKWYLVFQSGQPQYTTTDDLTKPESWAKPVDFFQGVPRIVNDNRGSGGWLDFNVICDKAYCHLFFTDDNGHLYESRTKLADFPNGFGDPVIAIKGTKEQVFEASQTYRVAGTGQYLTIVEAFGPNGHRFFRSFVASTLDGEWTPLAASWDIPFAGTSNVTFESGKVWTADISHGELLRDNYDQTPTVSLPCLRFLYQGIKPELSRGAYQALPWRLGLLTLTD